MPILINQPWFLVLGMLLPFIAWLALRRGAGRWPRPRRLLIVGCRLLAVGLLVAALADPRWAVDTDQVNVVFCADLSASVHPDAFEKTAAFVRRTGRTSGERHRSGLIVFAQEARVQVPLTAGVLLPDPGIPEDRGETDLAGAIETALGMLPMGGENRIVLLSDGRQTRGNALAAADLAKSMGVAILTVALPTWRGEQDVAVTQLHVPSAVPLQATFAVRAEIDSAAPTRAEIVLLRNGGVVRSQRASLSRGGNSFVWNDVLAEPGLVRYEIVVSAPGDTMALNNRALAFTRATHKTSVLYVHANDGRQGAPDPARALSVQGMDVVLRNGRDLPVHRAQLDTYAAVVLDNVPAGSLTMAAMEALRDFVDNGGGGLVMIGGPASFGAGQYVGTPVEDALPVFMDIPTPVDMPRLDLVLVLDRSASMSATSMERSKIDMALEAAFGAVELINPEDQVGIIGFDTKSQWVVPLTPARERPGIARLLAEVSTSGGTDLYPALKQAYEVLKQRDTQKKRVIVLSDGLVAKGDFRTLVGQMRRAGITLSTVALGGKSDVMMMGRLARWGGGRTYYTNDPAHIPRIFAGETRLMVKPVIVERDMPVASVRPSAILEGLATESLPDVGGQVAVYAKPGAAVALETEAGPLLAAWNRGLGRSVAYTSDLGSRWGRGWLQWKGYEQFVGQMVKWAARKEKPFPWEINFERRAGRTVLRVDALDSRERPVNDLRLRLRVVDPLDNARTTVLTQTAPGLYEGVFDSRRPGAYSLTVVQADEGEGKRYSLGYAVPFTVEFAGSGADTTLLETIARKTGGRVLELAAPPRDLFRHRGRAAEGLPVWPWLVLIAVGLWLVDIGCRKWLPVV